MTSPRKRYALVGTGGRCAMFLEAIADKSAYADTSELVGLCDLSPTRMNYWADRLVKKFSIERPPCYAAENFDQMIEQARPDTVIVTTMDSVHHTYIIRAMELGCDVICEKPMTIDEVKAQEILDVQARTGKNIRVTFNYRYVPAATKVRELIADGVIGDPLVVDFMWVLDTRHGADYFRRWHREKDKSGGLLVHKSTHHFDLINFWIDSSPQTVMAMGDLSFYGKDNAKARGEHYDYDRYTNSEQAKDDPFCLSLNNGDETLQKLYFEAESDSGYVRDRNVFGENITAEDRMGVLCRYRNGVQLNYSLLAYSPWEGYRAAVTGTKGRIELFVQHGSHIITGQSDEELAKTQAQKHQDELKVFPMFGEPYVVEVPHAKGSHGGGDAILLNQMFAADPTPDPFGRGASHVDGAASILLGIAANKSIASGQSVAIDDLIHFPTPELERAAK